jgi:hypothetical protein
LDSASADLQAPTLTYLVATVLADWLARTIGAGELKALEGHGIDAIADQFGDVTLDLDEGGGIEFGVDGLQLPVHEKGHEEAFTRTRAP